jgi:tripartite-type tricarboxylate transporter receptor subunit TctC
MKPVAHALRLARSLAAFSLALCFASSAAAQALAQDVADFYKGKQVTIGIGFTPGGSSSLYAQALARHMGRFMPGSPNFIVQHVPGAGGLVLANNIYNTVTRDGLAFAITGRTAAIEPLLGNANAKFDGRRFGWIGTANVEYTTCLAWHTA